MSTYHIPNFIIEKTRIMAERARRLGYALSDPKPAGYDLVGRPVFSFEVTTEDGAVVFSGRSLYVMEGVLAGVAAERARAEAANAR